MGAKDSLKFKLRRPTFKCDVCPKKFLSSQTLAKHIHLIHKVKGKVQQSAELNTLVGKSVKSLDSKKSVEESDLVLEVEPAKISDVRKVEYECPQCSQCFAVYFSAFRHIQKHHCINSKGIKVPSNSLEMIKPVRIEVCVKCNQRLRSNDPHSCTDFNVVIDPVATYVCMGCKQNFSSLKLFDVHITRIHSDEVETLFFPTRDEFDSWKDDVESQTKVKYLVLDKNSKLKQVYNCTYSALTETDEESIVHFCPSSIYVRDFTKSIQVHFYRQHFGHECKYMLADKFHKYRSKQLLKEPTPITEPYELNTLREDFVTLMDFLVTESKKCDKATLEILQKKAKDMLTVLNSSSEPKTKKRMTDEQISETLETLDAKKMRVGSPVSSGTVEPVKNTISAASDGENKRKAKRKTNSETPPVKFTIGSSPSSSKSSFNDSYKEFVEQTRKNIDPKIMSDKKNNNKIETEVKQTSPAQRPKPNILRNKKTIKTKIGQFKPSLSPKKIESVLVRDRRSSVGNLDFEYEVREQENDCNILVLKI